MLETNLTLQRSVWVCCYCGSKIKLDTVKLCVFSVSHKIHISAWKVYNFLAYISCQSCFPYYRQVQSQPWTHTSLAVNTDVISCDIVFFFLSVFPQDLVPASETLQSQIGASAPGQRCCTLLLWSHILGQKCIQSRWETPLAFHFYMFHIVLRNVKTTTGTQLF